MGTPIWTKFGRLMQKNADWAKIEYVSIRTYLSKDRIRTLRTLEPWSVPTLLFSRAWNTPAVEMRVVSDGSEPCVVADSADDLFMSPVKSGTQVPSETKITKIFATVILLPVFELFDVE